VLFENLCVEFEAAWDAMATSHFAERTSASFLFARQTMLLVELASTVARQDAATFRRFSNELEKREPLLFKRIPYQSGRGTRSCVPRTAADGDPTSELIEALFDLVRNGHAHFGHQLYAPLKDGRAFGVALLGAEPGRTMDKVRPPGGRTIHHLSCTKQSDGNLVMRLCTGTLYLDVRDASEAAGVWHLDADASSYTEQRVQGVSVEDLEAALEDPTGPYLMMFRSTPASR
jgi:hypothetical protein